jgi:hypothetical protein
MIRKGKRKTSPRAASHGDEATRYLWCRLTCARWSNRTAVGSRNILSSAYFGPCVDAWLAAKAQLQRISLPFPGSELRLLAATDVFRMREANQILPDAIDALARSWNEAWRDAQERLRGGLDSSDIVSLEKLRELHKVQLVFEPAAVCPNGLADISATNLCSKLSSLQNGA